LDRVDKNRSALLERAARAYLARLESDQRDRRDIEIINRNGERLNREVCDRGRTRKHGSSLLEGRPESRFCSQE
jgi:hypothetical protein